MIFATAAAAQLKTSVDTLSTSAQTKTIALGMDYPYVTVTVRNTAAESDTLRAYNIYRGRDTSSVAAVDKDGTAELMIIPAKTTMTFFMWDPIIDFLMLRKNSASDKTLILVTRAKYF